MFSTSHDQELIEERLNLSVVKGQMSYSYGSYFLIYILEDEPQGFKEAIFTHEVPHWKKECKKCFKSILEIHA